jgi:alpha-1,2-mannosyltransferase
MRNTALTLVMQFSALTAFLGGLHSLRRRSLSPRTMSLIMFALCGVLSTYVFLISEPSWKFSDFRRAYYPAGAAVLGATEGLAPLIAKGVDGFVNLPIVAYVFTPFALLPFNSAAVLYFCLGVAAAFLAWWLLVREAELNEIEKWQLLVLFSANGPLANSLREGNTSHFMLLGLVLAYACLRNDYRIGAGVIMGICAIIKLPLLLFGLYFLLRGMWRSALGFIFTIAFCCALSIIVFGWALNRQWFELCVLKFGSQPLGAFNVQSIPAFLARLFSGPEILENWSASPVPFGQRLAGSLSNAFIILAAAWVCLRPQFKPGEQRSFRDRETLEYCLFVTLAVIASPLSWSHYYVWLLLPIAFFLSEKSPIASSVHFRKIAWASTFLVSQAIVFIPLADPLLAAIYDKILVSSLLFGGLLWYAVLLVKCSKQSMQSAISGEQGHVT